MREKRPKTKKYSENFKIEIMESLVTLEKDPEWPIKLHLNTDLFSFIFQTIFMLHELQWQISKRWLYKNKTNIS